MGKTFKSCKRLVLKKSLKGSLSDNGQDLILKGNKVIAVIKNYKSSISAINEVTVNSVSHDINEYVPVSLSLAKNALAQEVAAWKSSAVGGSSDVSSAVLETEKTNPIGILANCYLDNQILPNS